VLINTLLLLLLVHEKVSLTRGKRRQRLGRLTHRWSSQGGTSPRGEAEGGGYHPEGGEELARDQRDL